MDVRLKLVSILAVCLTFSACKLLGTQKNTVNQRTTYKIINPDEVVIDRLGDGTSAQIRFTTQEDALCELFYYSQDPAETPSESAPVRVACSGAETARAEFNETVAGIKSESIYNFGIFVWTVAGTKEQGEVLVVRERVNGSGAIRNRAGAYEQILLARFNVPLRTAEIQKARLDPPMTAQSMLGRSGANLGCGPSLDEQSWMSRATVGKGGLSGLAMRGFAFADATETESRLLASFNALQFGNPEWEWTYQTPEQNNVLVKIRPPGRLTSVEVSQRTRTALAEVKLSDAEASISLDTGYPLTVFWQWDNVPATSFVHVWIGKSGETGSVHCAFDPKSGRGSLTPETFSGLPPGKHSLVIELESIVFHAASGWLERAVDWRSLKLEKS